MIYVVSACYILLLFACTRWAYERGRRENAERVIALLERYLPLEEPKTPRNDQ